MRSFTLHALVVTTLAAAPLCADFVNVEARPFVDEAWLANGFGSTGLTAWRIYATFDPVEPDDGVLAQFTVPGSAWSMHSSDGEFHNDIPLFDSLCAPEDLSPIGIWSNQWDTYVTIGRTETIDGDCELGEEFGNGTNWLTTNFDCEDCGYFVTPEDSDARPVHRRVLLGQFVVNEGEHIGGTLNLLLLNNTVHLDVDIVALGVCVADIDENGETGFGDLLRVLKAWGPCPPPCDEDLTHDGAVDFADILVVLSNWGPC